MLARVVFFAIRGKRVGSLLSGCLFGGEMRGTVRCWDVPALWTSGCQSDSWPLGSALHTRTRLGSRTRESSGILQFSLHLLPILDTYLPVARPSLVSGFQLVPSRNTAAPSMSSGPSRTVVDAGLRRPRVGHTKWLFGNPATDEMSNRPRRVQSYGKSLATGVLLL
jgi:hypothetical protein